MARQLHANSLEGFEVFKSLTQDPEVDCEPQPLGNLLIAHSPQAMQHLEAESRLCNNILGYRTRTLDRATVHRDFMGDQESHGAMLEPEGIAVQPLKLAYSYGRIARRHGARIHTSSPVQHWTTENPASFTRGLIARFEGGGCCFAPEMFQHEKSPTQRKLRGAWMFNALLKNEPLNITEASKGYQANLQSVSAAHDANANNE